MPVSTDGLGSSGIFFLNDLGLNPAESNFTFWTNLAGNFYSE